METRCRAKCRMAGAVRCHALRSLFRRTSEAGTWLRASALPGPCPQLFQRRQQVRLC